MNAEFAKALVAAQKATKAAIKDANNPHFKSRYADLASIFQACKEPFNENGIAILQSLGHVVNDGNGGGSVSVTTFLVHESGETFSDSFAIGLKDPNDPQKIGSAITYARRYGLAAICGVVADDDDDGNAASAGSSPSRATASPAKKEVSAAASAAIKRGVDLLALHEAGKASEQEAEELKSIVRTTSKDETRVVHPDWKRLYEGVVKHFKKDQPNG